jgi:hypothetical protein
MPNSGRTEDADEGLTGLGSNGHDAVPQPDLYAPPVRAPRIQRLLDTWAHAMRLAEDDARRLRAIATTSGLLVPFGDDGIEPREWLTESALYIYNLDADQVQAAMSEGVARAERPKTNSHGSSAAPALSSDWWRHELIDPWKLCEQKFPDLRYVVPGLFPEGVTLLASRPKLGKSWLLLQIGLNLARGTSTLVSSDNPPSGDVLYLALEDSPRRVKRRMQKHCGTNRDAWPRQFTPATKWRRLDQGGLDGIRQWCNSVEKPTLVIIDTLKRVRQPRGRNQTDYAADYEACEGLIKLAHEFPGLAIIVAHHDRKMDADDVFDTISGTLGLTGGVDTIAVMKRKAGGVTLHIEGRDVIEDVEKAIKFDRETCRWTVLGEAAVVQRSAERQRVVYALTAAPDGMAIKDIVAAASLKNDNAARKLLFTMAADGEVIRLKRGFFSLPQMQ